MTILLHNHTSPETAYIVEDYPYGFRLRCKIRYWLEYKPGNGFRLMSQTTNPKSHTIGWNKPKASTYMRFGGAMFLDEQNHVQWSGLSEYCSAEEASQWLATYGAAVPHEGQDTLRRWVAAKIAYAANRQKDDPLTVGLVEARKAWGAQ